MDERQAIDLSVMPTEDLMGEDHYIWLWNWYRELGLSSSGVLSFQEHMIYYYCPGRILSENGLIEYPRPNVGNIWGDRRNVSNYLEIRNGLPRRISRYPERIRVLRLSHDVFTEMQYDKQPSMLH